MSTAARLNRWDQEKVILAMQDTIYSLPTATAQDRKVKLDWLREYFRICGYYQPDVANQTTNNILIMTKEESKDVWKRRIKAQQRRLATKTQVAANT